MNQILYEKHIEYKCSECETNLNYYIKVCPNCNRQLKLFLNVIDNRKSIPNGVYNIIIKKQEVFDFTFFTMSQELTDFSLREIDAFKNYTSFEIPTTIVFYVVRDSFGNHVGQPIVFNKKNRKEYIWSNVTIYHFDLNELDLIEVRDILVFSKNKEHVMKQPNFTSYPFLDFNL